MIRDSIELERHANASIASSIAQTTEYMEYQK